MPSVISDEEAAHEGGTYKITVNFSDDSGAAVVPNAGLNWSLVKDDGVTIVNNRKEVAIAVPAEAVTIVLSGADLALDVGRSIQYRYLVIEGTYNSDIGIDLPLKDHVRFPIIDIAKVGVPGVSP